MTTLILIQTITMTYNLRHCYLIILYRHLHRHQHLIIFFHHHNQNLFHHHDHYHFLTIRLYFQQKTIIRRNLEGTRFREQVMIKTKQPKIKQEKVIKEIDMSIYVISESQNIEPYYIELNIE